MALWERKDSHLIVKDSHACTVSHRAQPSGDKKRKERKESNAGKGFHAE